MLYQLSVIFVLAVAWVLIARRAALVVGLVDKPNARKQHLGHIPLVGGIAVYLTLMLMTLWQPAWLPESTIYLLCITALVVLGVLDDRFDLPVAPRVMVQGGIALAMMLAAGMQLSSLGYVWGHQEVMLGYGALLLTPLAVWGAINAYNMVDGIDGQLGALSCVTFVALAIVFGLGGREDLALWCLGLIAALAAYLLFNLSLFGARSKIFMGDAGSMVIGFSVLWLVLLATQGTAGGDAPGDRAVADRHSSDGHGDGDGAPPAAPPKPIQSGARSFAPYSDASRTECAPGAGDEHHAGGDAGLHRHLQMRRGLNARQALAMSTMLAVTLACIGICSEVLKLQESLMLVAFLLCFCGYFALLREPRQATVFSDNPTVGR
nr:undecaprenyl-phosphate alpha-N-acetylglucosaminyl 1-phosphate transferase [Serratia marcescens]